MSSKNQTPSLIKEMTRDIVEFRDEREWGQFHNHKDMLLSLYLEVAELGEHLQWKGEAEIKEWLLSNSDQFGEELADILYWVLLIAHDSNIDLEAAFTHKMSQNRIKYPVEKARGQKQKYTEYSK